MNAPLRRVSVAVLLMFGLLLANANYLQVVKAEDLRSQPGNSRILLDEYARPRGPILVGTSPIARSVETNARLKFQRRYSGGAVYSPVTGFYSIVYGSTGIERAENDVLAGTAPGLFVRRIADLLTGQAARGGSVALTIDPRAQRAAWDGLAGRRGAVVAIDPSTGAILAMASSPAYDANLLSAADPAKVRTAYQRLNADPDKPLLNRALSQTYPPGSTFKIVTAAAALATGNYSPATEVFGGAQLDLPLTTARLPNFDGRPCTTGDVTTLLDALRRSCNTSFGSIGLALGDAALREQAEKFGFNARHDIPSRSAESVYPAQLNAPQTAQSAIGQFDVRATPLQMAMVVAAVANRGVLMTPHLVKEVRGPDLSVLDGVEPREMGEAVSPQVAAQLAQMMLAVVEDGTGSNARIDGVQVAGKTGTAQQGNGRPPHAWFVSFAPVQDPRIAVAVVIEDGGGVAEVSGNKLAAPIARAVTAAVLGR